jgi:hypothetical protein
MLAARFVAMLRSITLDDDDLEIAERACRSLAKTYKRDAAKQANPERPIQCSRTRLGVNGWPSG